MQLNDYPTPSDVKIYIGPHLVDDAYRVEYDERNSKMPLTGYHQKKYASVADGKLIIVGNIIIHYRFPGYLTHAIKNILNLRELNFLTDPKHGGQYPTQSWQGMSPVGEKRTSTYTKTDVVSELQLIRKSTPSQRVALLARSFQLGFFEFESALLKNTFENRTDTRSTDQRKFNPLESVAEMSPHDFINGERGIDLSLYYGYVGSGSQAAYVTEVLEGVHFTGRRKVVNASTSGGDLSASGQSLLEVYPFFARSVRSVVNQAPT